VVFIDKFRYVICVSVKKIVPSVRLMLLEGFPCYCALNLEEENLRYVLRLNVCTTRHTFS
jgi:hypothetical protein